MGSTGNPKRAVRIGGASGGFTDRQRSIMSFARDNDVDVIMGDWMSEMTMQWHGAAKHDLIKAGKSDEERAGLFDPSFMGTLIPALPYLQQRKVKLAVNAGASDTKMLAELVEKKIKEQGLSLKVAWVQGDEVLDVVQRLMKQGEKFENICYGGNLEDWPFEPIAAQCYLGGAGIAEALRAGADIVICGRVSDAAPVVGACMWWHGWDRNKDFDQIASSLVAGHLIECSSYVCGGYYSGFKDLFQGCENVGFPIAAINPDGTFTLEKEPNTGGEMSVGTATSQLLYEIQGPLYYGSDVVANLEGIKMEQLQKDIVLVTGVKGCPPPTTTKVGITARGGYQAEFHFYMCGLDLKEKAEWTERQIRYSIGKHISNLSLLKFSLNGWCQEDPESQDVATVDFRIFAQTTEPELLGVGSMVGFQRWCMENFLQSCPGASIENDLRQTSGKEFFEYWVSLMPQTEINHEVHFLWNKQSRQIPPANNLKDYGTTFGTRQWTYDPKAPLDLASCGPTTRGPLGYVALGRSGDKASDANVGFFARNEEEWQWLRSLLTVAKIKELLGSEYNGKGVDRFEMPGIRAVHFLLHDHLDRGWSATSTYDGLGKNVCEYLRAKYVDIPIAFLERGKVGDQKRINY
ncbi:hypothetical protein BDV59DRAFT_192591 [Aspergillus ambiguus]|uniref:acyclic terpene utilization AtuA family protein n=1 Tax=Aspergillus ambiguus TaxID=176160 RepID=UPI003CCD74C2